MRIGGSALPSMSLVEAPYKDMLGFACGYGASSLLSPISCTCPIRALLTADTTSLELTPLPF